MIHKSVENVFQRSSRITCLTTLRKCLIDSRPRPRERCGACAWLCPCDSLTRTPPGRQEHARSEYREAESRVCGCACDKAVEPSPEKPKCVQYRFHPRHSLHTLQLNFTMCAAHDHMRLARPQREFISSLSCWSHRAFHIYSCNHYTIESDLMLRIFRVYSTRAPSTVKSQSDLGYIAYRDASQMA